MRILLLFVFLVPILSASAQHDQQMAAAKERIARINKHLGLDEATSQRLITIMLENEERLMPLRAEMERLQAECDALTGKSDERLAEVLTPEQLDKLRQLEAEIPGVPHITSCTAMVVEGELRCCAAAAARDARTGRQTKPGMERDGKREDPARLRTLDEGTVVPVEPEAAPGKKKR